MLLVSRNSDAATSALIAGLENGQFGCLYLSLLSCSLTGHSFSDKKFQKFQWMENVDT